MLVPMNRVREFREGLHLNREALAYKTGLTVKTIERIETGRHAPRLENALQIAAVLQQRIDVVFPPREVEVPA